MNQPRDVTADIVANIVVVELEINEDSTMTPAFDEALGRYFRDQERARKERAERVWAMMTKREQLLVKEVAVMAHVRALPYGERPLPTSALLVDVLTACLGMSDLYPTVTRLERLATRKQMKQDA